MMEVVAGRKEKYQVWAQAPDVSLGTRLQAPSTASPMHGLWVPATVALMAPEARAVATTAAVVSWYVPTGKPHRLWDILMQGLQLNIPCCPKEPGEACPRRR